MKLWVFGCSYSISSSFKHKDLWDYDKNWIDVVAENLNIDKNNNKEEAVTMTGS